MRYEKAERSDRKAEYKTWILSYVERRSRDSQSHRGGELVA
jgi:hypothetical protein